MNYLDIVLDCFDSIFDWLSELNNNFNFLSVVFAVFVLGLIYRFLLQPLIGGSSGSDSAKRRKK